VAGKPTVLADNKALGLDSVGFKILLVDPVITDQGISHHQNLSFVRWICESLLIASHIGVENQLSENCILGTESLTLYNGAVL
jgi:hypothetical protein